MRMLKTVTGPGESGMILAQAARLPPPGSARSPGRSIRYELTRSEPAGRKPRQGPCAAPTARSRPAAALHLRLGSLSRRPERSLAGRLRRSAAHPPPSRPRRLGPARSAWRAAWHVCAALVLPLVPPSALDLAAQTTLVSNTGQTKATGTLFYGWDGSKHLDRALAFTTGSNFTGYTLSAVDVRLASGTPSTNTRVSIYTTRSNPPIPESSLHVLNNPSSLTGNAINTFSADSGTSLDPNTTYAVVIEIISGTDSTDLDRTVSNAEDSGAASGWSIADNAATHDRAEGIWKILLTDFNKPLITIRGTAKPLPPKLVSNTGQADSDTISIGLNFDRHVGLAFTTGGNTAGYTLSAVEAKLGSTVDDETQVSIYTTSSDGLPDSSLHVLNNPSSLTASAINTFPADAGATLAANTTYAVLFNIDLQTPLVTDDTVLRLTSSASEDANPASGWSIADEAYLRDFVGSNANLGWREVSSKLKPLIAIRATARTLAITSPPEPSAPSAPRNLTAVGGIGEVMLRWEIPPSDGGAAITDYEYRINGRRRWISIGSTQTTHTVTGLNSGTAYVFEVRAVNRAGAGPSRRVEATTGTVLDFPHFANGEGITSEVVLVNVGAMPARPILYFSDQQGEPIAADSVVDVTGDLMVTEDGSLTLHTVMEPLGEFTIATHGRGDLVSGSLRVASGVPIGGLVRYSAPDVGVAGVGASPPVRDVLFPTRRQEEGIRTAAALHNPGEEALGVSCRLMSGGVALEEVEIPLEANGQTSWFIEEVFTATDTSDFLGSVRCSVSVSRRFTAIAVETDAAQRIFTALPVVEVDRTGGSYGESVLDFAHFANGTWVTDLVFVNPSIEASRPRLNPFHTPILPTRPSIYFYDTEGNPIDPASLVDLTGDLEITEDGALTLRTGMEPLGLLTISTHGRGELVTGSVRVVSEGPIGGMLRFAHPALGAAGVGASLPVSDAIVPVRRQEGGINTGIALHNLESSSSLLRCELMQAGVLRDSVSIPLAANGQTSWSIDQAFPATDTSDFLGSLRCSTPGGDLFTAVALEMDSSARTFTTLPVVPVPEMPSRE